MAENNFQFSSARDTNDLPSNFKFLKLLGAGSFGKVVRCLKKDTKQTVAIKIPKFLWQDSTEVSMMEKLMRLKMDKHNIVQFLGWFHTGCGKAMVFESLDISLYDFITQRNCAPMLLSDIRTIIEQLATSFDALRMLGVIHCDLKLDNVMMVDHSRRPYNVKLIDFGLAMNRYETIQGMALQVPSYRAPEIILGLPFSMPIDIWSLGCMMAIMLNGFKLFQGENEYEVLHDIIAHLGMPADHLLDFGLKTQKYFTQCNCNGWRLKTYHEYWREHKNQRQYETTMCYRLRHMRGVQLEDDNKSEAVQRAQCVDLLEAMLCLDEAKRITPFEILTHPFMTNSNKKKKKLKQKKTRLNPRTLPPPPCRNKVCPAAAGIQDPPRNPRPLPPPPPCEIKDRPRKRRCRKKVHPADREDISEEPPAATATPPGVTLVRPVAARNTLQLKEDKDRAARLPAGTNKTDEDPMDRTQDCAGTQKKKKKKNCVRRFFSWMKRTFG